MGTLQVAAIQSKVSDIAAENLDKTEAMATEAVTNGAQLIVLQELFHLPYFCKVQDPTLFDLAEPIPGPTTQWLAGLAKKLNVVLVTSIFEKRAPGLYHNTAVVLDTDGSFAGTYRKMHIPEDPGYHEKFYFTPGDADPGFQPIQTSLGKLGVLVCWDQWYPEAARLMALAGAEMLIYPTAIGWDTGDTPEEQRKQADAWMMVQVGHAVANQVPVIAANRVGMEEAKDGTKTISSLFWGSSFIAGPQGEVLAIASAEVEQTIHATLDLGRTEELRRMWPFMRDRRIDAFGGILKRNLQP